MGKHSQKLTLSCRMTEHSLLTNYFDTSCWLGATITMSLPNTTSFVLPHHSFNGEIMLEWTINYQKRITTNSHNITQWVLHWKLEFCSGELLCSKSLASVQYLRSALLWLTASLHRNDTAINHINTGPTNQEQKMHPQGFTQSALIT